MKHIDEITNDIVAVLGDPDVAWKRRTVDQIAIAIIECERLERELLETVDAKRRQVGPGSGSSSGRDMRFIDAIDKASELGKRLGLDWSHETGDGDVPVKRVFQLLDTRPVPLSRSALTAHLAAMAPVYDRWQREALEEKESRYDDS